MVQQVWVGILFGCLVCFGQEPSPDKSLISIEIAKLKLAQFVQGKGTDKIIRLRLPKGILGENSPEVVSLQELTALVNKAPLSPSQNFQILGLLQTATEELAQKKKLPDSPLLQELTPEQQKTLSQSVIERDLSKAKSDLRESELSIEIPKELASKLFDDENKTKAKGQDIEAALKSEKLALTPEQWQELTGVIRTQTAHARGEGFESGLDEELAAFGGIKTRNEIQKNSKTDAAPRFADFYNDDPFGISELLRLMSQKNQAALPPIFRPQPFSLPVAEPSTPFPVAAPKPVTLAPEQILDLRRPGQVRLVPRGSYGQPIPAPKGYVSLPFNSSMIGPNDPVDLSTEKGHAMLDARDDGGFSIAMQAMYAHQPGSVSNCRATVVKKKEDPNGVDCGYLIAGARHCVRDEEDPKQHCQNPNATPPENKRLVGLAFGGMELEQVGQFIFAPRCEDMFLVPVKAKCNAAIPIAEIAPTPPSAGSELVVGGPIPLIGKALPAIEGHDVVPVDLRDPVNGGILARQGNSGSAAVQMVRDKNNQWVAQLTGVLSFIPTDTQSQGIAFITSSNALKWAKSVADGELVNTGTPSLVLGPDHRR